MSRILLTSILAATALLPFHPANAAEPAPYAPAFTPLPLGAIKPAGWLRDWCQDAANGIAGHADELAPLFKDGWMKDAKVEFATDHIQVGDKPKGYMLEQSAYWMDGAVRLAHLLDDEALLAKCRLRFDAVLRRVAAGQPPVNVNQDMWQKGEKWAHWPMAVMGRALVAEYSATGDARYLRGLEKIYAAYSKFDAGGKAFSLIGHNGRQVTNVEPMFEAFRLGGAASLRDEAIAVLQLESNEIKDRLSWHEQGIANGKTDARFYNVQYGHGVTFNESTKLPAIGFLYTGNSEWLRFSEASFEDMEKNEMLPYGLTSAHEEPGGIGPFALTELCNAVDYSWSNIWLLRITGHSNYGDRIEKTVFNAGPGGISPDFKAHAYYLCPNRIDATHPLRPEKRAGSTTQFAPKHNPLCCTGNISRLLPNYVMHLWMASADGGLAATLYGPSTAKTAVNGTPLSLETKTDYPFGDEVEITLSPEQPVAFPLHLRVPGWSAAPALSVNKKPIETTIEHGFVSLKRTWKSGDVVRLVFSRQPKLLTGVCADGAPYASAYYGPLLFALPIPTLGGNLNEPQPGVESQFALFTAKRPEVVHNAMPARWSWNATPAPIELKVSAVPVVSDTNFSLAKSPAPSDGAKPQTLTLVPFGQTAFRVSMFGVTAQ